MKNSNALRLWGFCMFAMTICLLALLIQDQVGTRVEETVVLTVDTTTTTSTTTSTTTTTTAPPVVIAEPKPSVPESTEAFFECIRWVESRNDYSAISTSGTFMGAYQIYQEGWNAFARMSGRLDLIDVSPHTALPSDQDAIALAMHNQLGSKPWNGACE